jgi:hypothetical protein
MMLMCAPVAHAGLFFVIVFENVPLLIGALIGGALAE